MNLHEILSNIEIQSEFIVVIYDEEKEQRYKVNWDCPFGKSIEIQYMYTEHNVLFIELKYEHLKYEIKDNPYLREWFYLSKI